MGPAAAETKSVCTEVVRVCVFCFMTFTFILYIRSRRMCLGTLEGALNEPGNSLSLLTLATGEVSAVHRKAPRKVLGGVKMHSYDACILHRK